VPVAVVEVFATVGIGGVLMTDVPVGPGMTMCCAVLEALAVGESCGMS